jgi:hypothetical protein
MLSPPRPNAWPAHATEGRLRAVYGRKRGGGPTVERESTAEASGRSYAEDRSVWRVAVLDTGAHALAWRRHRPFQVLFRLSLFEIAKLQKSSTNSKISKNKSCRGAIDLQLSQRATYVLINGLSRNIGRSWKNSRPQLTVTACSTQFLANLHSKLEWPPITKNVFPEITNNFRIGRF